MSSLNIDELYASIDQKNTKRSSKSLMEYLKTFILELNTMRDQERTFCFFFKYQTDLL